MSEIIVNVIKTLGEWLFKLLSYFLLYKKGMGDCSYEILKKNNKILEKQAIISAEPNLSRTELLVKLHSGDL